MHRAQRIEQALDAELDLKHIDVQDESANHSVPDGAQSHFKVTAVASEFEGLGRVHRHRLVNELLKAEFDGGMHALALHLYTDTEWDKRFGDVPMSPPCLGGSGAEAGDGGG